MSAARALALLVLVGCPALAATSAPTAARGDRQRRAAAVLDALARPELAEATVAIEVRRLSDGQVLCSRDAGRAVHPASCLKLVTTAAALDALGPEARVRTSVESAARLDAMGRLLGDVYLVGRGDPGLSPHFEAPGQAPAFERLAEDLLHAGVRRIEGRLLGHEGAFRGERRGSDWSWEDLVWSYGAEASALSWHDNAVELRLRPGELQGDPALLQLEPTTPLLAIGNEVKTVAAGTPQELRLSKETGPNRLRLAGSLPIGGRWAGRVAIEDPAAFAAHAFAAALQQRGIAVAGGVATTQEPLPAGARALAESFGPPLSEIVRATNKDSLNLQAELLLRLVGQKVTGDGSAEKGALALTAFLERLGVGSEGWQMRDGCGLSRSDLVTAHGMVDLLAAMDRHPLAALFRDSLPVAGVDGTLESRFRGTPAAGRVAAKTGTLGLAQALAGYATTPGGERVVFAVFVNNARRPREALAAIDAAVLAIVEP